MDLVELINKLVEELSINGNHKVFIEYDTEYDNNIDGIRCVKIGKGPMTQVKYYISNNT